MVEGEWVSGWVNEDLLYILISVCCVDKERFCGRGGSGYDINKQDWMIDRKMSTNSSTFGCCVIANERVKWESQSIEW